MSDTEKVDFQFHFQRHGKKKVFVEGKEPPKPPEPSWKEQQKLWKVMVDANHH